MDNYYFLAISSPEYNSMISTVMEILREHGIDCDVEIIAKDCVDALILNRREQPNA